MVAVDNLERDYYLTPKGWVTGNSWFFGVLHGAEKPLPPDRVLTVIERTYQVSGYSPESVTVREVWRAVEADEQIAALKKQFPLFD